MKAVWIAHPDNPAAAPVFRRRVALPSPAAAARLRYSALGSAWIRVNGVELDHVLGPGLSDYSVCARVRETELEIEGDVLSVVAEIGNGFHSFPTPNVWGWDSPHWEGPRGLWMELEVTLTDGTTHTIATSPEWRAGTGGTRFDSLYEGETFDESWENEGLCSPEFDDAHWPLAVTFDGPELRTALAPPVVRGTTHAPRWSKRADGIWQGDLGRVMSVGLDVRPLRSDVDIRITMTERLDDDGHPYGNEHVHTSRFQRHDIRSGCPWRSRHTWFGARYLLVEGAEVGTDVEVDAIEIHAELPRAGTFRCSHPTLQWIHDAFVDTVLANAQWVLTDTPTYEKNGWLGDAHTALPALFHVFDMETMLTSWLQDFEDGMRPDGELPVIAPTPGWGFAGTVCAPAPEWTSFFPHLAVELRREYGSEAWKRHRGAIGRYIDRELDLLDDEGLAKGVLGDYLAPGREGPSPEDGRFWATAMLARALHDWAEQTSDQALEGRATRLDQSLRDRFMDPTSGNFVFPRSGFRQGPQTFALARDLVPQELRRSAAAALVEDIEAKGEHHDMGVLGLPWLPAALAEAGRPDLVLAVLANPTAPSFRAWQDAGHGTLLEFWDEPGRSHAHYFQGGVVAWLYGGLAGLRRLDDRWTTFAFEPTPVPGVDDVAVTRQTRAGEIRAFWQRHGQEIAYELVVPEGATAVIRLTGMDEYVVGPGRHTGRWINAAG